MIGNRTYLRCAGRFLQQLDRPLSDVQLPDVKAFLLTLANQGVEPRTRNVYVAAIRFLFRTILRRPEVTAGSLRAKVQPTVPVVLSGSSSSDRGLGVS
jgi:hypothetical protein